MPELATREQGLALLAELESAGALSRTGLKITDPNISYERMEAIGFLLGEIDECIKFAMGDWLLYCEAIFPSEFSQLSEALGHNEEYRRDLMRVAERVPRSRRRKALKWSHHRAVAALEPERQKEWLRRAVEEGLSHHALREALRDGGEAAVAPPLTLCRCCGQSLS